MRAQIAVPYHLIARLVSTSLDKVSRDRGGKDVFVHATALERAGLRGLAEGQKVSFDV